MVMTICLIPERYGQTDGQICYITSRVSLLTRDKNQLLETLSCGFNLCDNS